METWLDKSIPEKNGESPVEGYKFLQFYDPHNENVPMKYKTFMAIRRTCKLPPLELDSSTVYQGEKEGQFVRAG